MCVGVCVHKGSDPAKLCTSGSSNAACHNIFSSSVCPPVSTSVSVDLSIGPYFNLF